MISAEGTGTVKALREEDSVLHVPVTEPGQLELVSDCE